MESTTQERSALPVPSQNELQDQAGLLALDYQVAADYQRRWRDGQIRSAAKVIRRHGTARSTGRIPTDARIEVENLLATADEAAERVARYENIREEQSRIAVTRNVRVYGPGSQHSYFADLASVSAGTGVLDGAEDRQKRYAREVGVEVVAGSTEGRYVVQSVLNENRSDSPINAMRALEERTGNFGAFVAPYFLTQDTAIYQSYGRALADQVRRLPLPEYGLTVEIPRFTSANDVETQIADLSGLADSDSSGAVINAPLVTKAGQVTISQQFFDRTQSQPTGASADALIFAQLTEAYDTTVDAYVVAQALANAGSVTGAATYSVANVWTDLGKAAGQMRTAAGTVLQPTHTFLPPLQWTQLAAQVDSSNRPIIVPSPTLPTNAAGQVVEGNVGYTGPAGRFFTDGNIPAASGGGAQVLVVHAPEVWLFEGVPTMRAVPEAYGANMSVLLQLYSYVGVAVRYPQAVQTITGAAYPLNPTV